jgi:hypothetical protein
MTSIAQSIALPEFKVRPPRRQISLAAWSNLFFGPGPIWMRLLRWGQRNTLD